MGQVKEKRDRYTGRRKIVRGQSGQWAQYHTLTPGCQQGALPGSELPEGQCLGSSHITLGGTLNLQPPPGPPGATATQCQRGWGAEQRE